MKTKPAEPDLLEVHPQTTGPSSGNLRRVAAGAAGPVLIVAAVLIVLHDLAFGQNLTTQHPDFLPFWLPTYCFLGKTLAAGHIPAWNPFVMGGVPFAADPQTGWLYVPPMVLFSTLSCATALRWMAVFQPLLAGLGLYWFLRGERVSRPAATAGGLAISVTVAATVLALFLPFAGAIAWTTIVLATSSRFLRAAGARRRILWGIAAALAWGQLASAHAEQGVILGTGAMAPFIAAKAIREVRDGRWRARACLGWLAFLLGCLIAVNLALILPRFSYLPRSSYHLSYGALVKVQSLAPDWPLGFATTPGAHMGAAIISLVFAGFWSRRHRPVAIAMGSFGALCYVLSLKVVAVPLAHLVESWPVLGFYSHYPRRLGLGLVIALPVLGALGIEAIREAGSNRRRLFMLAPGVLAWYVLPPLLGAGMKNMGLLLLGGVATGLLLIFAGRRPTLAAGVPVILAMELVLNGLTGAHPGGLVASPPRFLLTAWFEPLEKPDVTPSSYLTPSPIALAIQRDGGRYVSVGEIGGTVASGFTSQGPDHWGLLSNQRSALFGIEDALGYNPVQVARYWLLIRGLSGHPIQYNLTEVPIYAPQVTDVLGVQDVVGRSESSPGAVNPEPIARDGAWALYRLARAPRASVITSWNVVSQPSSALAEVVDPGFDGQRSAVVEMTANQGPTGPPPQGGSNALHGRATFRWLGTQAARVEVDTPTRALVVIRNVFDPNWRATVDGHAATVLPVDYLIQGVFVAPGRHTIVLSYNDHTIGEGAAGSIVALALLAGAAWVAGRRSLRSRPTKDLG